MTLLFQLPPFSARLFRDEQEQPKLGYAWMAKYLETFLELIQLNGDPPLEAEVNAEAFEIPYMANGSQPHYHLDNIQKCLQTKKESSQVTAPINQTFGGYWQSNGGIYLCHRSIVHGGAELV